jgi:hypothetical protein
MRATSALHVVFLSTATVAVLAQQAPFRTRVDIVEANAIVVDADATKYQQAIVGRPRSATYLDIPPTPLQT